LFWKAIPGTGLVYGDPDRKSGVRVAHKLYFSYPGYSELLTGYADTRVKSNAKIPNPNTTVLEWLNNKPAWAGQVAVFSSRDVFPFIVNQRRSGLFVNAGWNIRVTNPSAPRHILYRKLSRVWHNVRYDYLTLAAAVDHIQNHKPRVLYVAFDETNDWAHTGRYDLYLDVASHQSHGSRTSTK